MTHGTLPAYAPGDTLNNGAIIVATKPAGPPRANEERYVLAVIPHNDVSPYVIWTLYPATGMTLQGDYFADLDEAVEQFRHR
jgi:hypothetical protein